MVDGAHTITELVDSLCIRPPMTTMVYPAASLSPLPLSIVTQACPRRPPPKMGDHWLVEFHCNCDDNDDDDDDDKELMISRPDISICSCIVMVFVMRAMCVFPCFWMFSQEHQCCMWVWCALSYSSCALCRRGVGPAKRAIDLYRQKSIPGTYSSTQRRADTRRDWLPPTQSSIDVILFYD